MAEHCRERRTNNNNNKADLIVSAERGKEEMMGQRMSVFLIRK